jgi:hypothetical protein
MGRRAPAAVQWDHRTYGNGTWRPQYTPKLKKRPALLHKLADIFRRTHSQPASQVVERINPILHHRMMKGERTQAEDRDRAPRPLSLETNTG